MTGSLVDMPRILPRRFSTHAAAFPCFATPNIAMGVTCLHQVVLSLEAMGREDICERNSGQRHSNRRVKCDGCLPLSKWLGDFSGSDLVASIERHFLPSLPSLPFICEYKLYDGARFHNTIFL